MVPQNSIFTELNKLTEWEDKYEYLIELGKDLPEPATDIKQEENKVIGCTSRIWIRATSKNNLLKFEAKSDSLLVAGLAALLFSVFNNKSGPEIVETKTDFLSELGLDKYLSNNRVNGLVAITRKIKEIASLSKNR